MAEHTHAGASHPRPPTSTTFLLSVVVPVFNEQVNIETFYRSVLEVVTDVPSLSLEFVFVNDGSHDASLDVMLHLKSEDDRIQIIDFSRNFGKEAATTAGLHFAKGDAAVLMDADLQHPAEILPAMIARWQDGFDVVLAKRRRRSKEPLLRRFLSLLYYRIHNRLSHPQLPEHVGDFRLISRRVIDAVNLMAENTRFMKGILTWVGFDSTVVLYEEGNRRNGQSRFNLRNLLNFALDGLFSFSIAPLRIWMYVGFSVGAASFLYVLLILIKVVVYGRDVPGYASLMVAIGLIGGLNLMGIGALGEYLGRTFMESKKRPLYIVKDHYAFNCRHANASPQSPQDA